MQLSTILTMVLTIAIIWGGFGFLIVLALRKEAEKEEDAEEPAPGAPG